ncbi:MAG: hypothetical protein JRI79_01085 [Deltaproteobacteria bacterium]|nr:hypothetical protein [Deltaproteobacteria bacterium]MBW1918781.1 hypothetical protein [Deltaproteobacteria bacterium]MBW1934790.1 hypothetical protein [Deltaproteobacteria bacterium]MBW1976551.1 hypothetical protein [Deltaproteobacteria bacterium]MBW2044931.1 hypothetical protein [Deltaproteobacteria bacterium]
MDERDIEQGYANFHRRLNHVLRQRDVKAFKAHVARHPAQAGRLSHCLGLSDELAEIEMYKAILARSALKDMHRDALTWLRDRGIEAPLSFTRRKKGRGKKLLAKRARSRSRGH